MFECQTHHLSLPCRCLSRTCKAFVVAPMPRAQHRLLTALALRQEPPDLVARRWWRTQASPLPLEATTRAASVPASHAGKVASADSARRHHCHPVDLAICFGDQLELQRWLHRLRKERIAVKKISLKRQRFHFFIRKFHFWHDTKPLRPELQNIECRVFINKNTVRLKLMATTCLAIFYH